MSPPVKECLEEATAISDRNIAEGINQYENRGKASYHQEAPPCVFFGGKEEKEGGKIDDQSEDKDLRHG